VWHSAIGDEDVAKSRFLQIRLSPEDRKRIDAAAASQYLDASTLARQVLLQVLEDYEQRRTQERKPPDL